jgi:hypothetical protein
MMTVAVDTNILLSRDDEGCLEFFQYLKMDSPSPSFYVALDKNGEILREYEKYGYGRESWIRQVLKRIWDKPDHYAMRIDYDFQPDQEKILSQVGCEKPIEPQLIGLASIRPEIMAIYPRDIQRKIPREYPRQLRRLQALGLARNMLPLGEALKRIRIPHVDFKTREDLESFLDYHCSVEGVRTESEIHEFKGPGKILTYEMLVDIAEAVCCLINKRGGWIFVGVNKDGRIAGFLPIYKRGGKPAVNGTDEIQNILLQEIGNIRPSPAQLVSMSAVGVGRGRIVISIFVRPGSRKRGELLRCYRGKAYQRSGTTCPEVDAQLE